MIYVIRERQSKSRSYWLDFAGGVGITRKHGGLLFRVLGDVIYSSRSPSCDMNLTSRMFRGEDNDDSGDKIGISSRTRKDS